MKDITDTTPIIITIRPKWNAIFKHGRHSSRHQMLNRNLAYEQALYNKPFEACTEKELFTIWKDLNLNFLNALKRFCGIKGEKVKPMMKGEVLNVVVPYNIAYDVFVKVSIPKFYAMTKKIYPQLDTLNEDTQGALVSMVYNRGASLVGDGRKEMRAIVDLVAKKDYEGIADQIEASKRLWESKGLDGLVIRREGEADLVRDSIA